jgi:hypothetical protein
LTIQIDATRQLLYTFSKQGYSAITSHVNFKHQIDVESLFPMDSVRLREAHDRQIALCSDIVAELQIMRQLTNAQTQQEMRILQNAEIMWRSLREISAIVMSISTALDGFTNRAQHRSLDDVCAYQRLLDDQALLQAELAHIRSLSQTISCTASMIKNRRLSPILNTLWSLSEHGHNAQQLTSIQKLCAILMDLAMRGETCGIVCAGIGILNNMAKTAVGLCTITRFVLENGFPLTKQLSIIDQKFGDTKLRGLILQLLENLTNDDSICFQMIREDCFGYLRDLLDDVMETDRVSVFGIANCLVQSKFVKTINVMCRDSAVRFIEYMEALGMSKEAARMGEIIGMERPSATKQVQRFGVKRTFALSPRI